MNRFSVFRYAIRCHAQANCRKVTAYIQKNDVSNGLVVLFDMGSLKEIYQYIPELMVPIVMMNNVTTSVAIAVGNVSSKMFR